MALDVLLGRVGEHARRRPVLRRDDELGGRAHAVEDLVVVAPQLAAVEHDARARDLRAQFLDDARLGQLDVAGGHDVLVSSVMERHAVLLDVVGVAAHQTQVGGDLGHEREERVVHGAGAEGDDALLVVEAELLGRLRVRRAVSRVQARFPRRRRAPPCCS